MTDPSRNTRPGAVDGFRGRRKWNTSGPQGPARFWRGFRRAPRISCDGPVTSRVCRTRESRMRASSNPRVECGLPHRSGSASLGSWGRTLYRILYWTQRTCAHLSAPESAEPCAFWPQRTATRRPSKPVRRGSPTLGRFDSCAAPFLAIPHQSLRFRPPITTL
jgi:hypothetical protein